MKKIKHFILVFILFFTVSTNSFAAENNLELNRQDSTSFSFKTVGSRPSKPLPPSEENLNSFDTHFSSDNLNNKKGTLKQLNAINNNYSASVGLAFMFVATSLYLKQNHHDNKEK